MSGWIFGISERRSAWASVYITTSRKAAPLNAVAESFTQRGLAFGQSGIGQRFWVHASQRQLTKADFEDFLADVRELRIKRYPKSIDDFVYGAIVGSAVIEKVVRGSKSFWAVRGNHHWVLGRARRCPPKKRKGQLGFFKVKGGR